MFNRSKAQKTCWSTVVNFFSAIKASQLLVGYLYVSGLFLNKFAKAHPDEVTETYYLPAFAKYEEPASACVNAAPGYMYIVHRDEQLNGFTLFQTSNNSEAGEGSLGDQIKNKRFLGNKLCNSKVISTLSENPINQIDRHNSEYSINLEKEDRIEVTYRRIK